MGGAPRGRTGMEIDMAGPTFTLAFQGEPGAFSEEAAQRAFGTGVRTVACRSFEEMFAAVVAGAAAAAVVPIENTLAGSVIRNYDLLAEHDLVVAAELVLRVVHNLIALPNARIGDLRRVLSHPVALAQCSGFFKEQPQLEAVPAYDTAGAVKMIMEAGVPSDAAIGSRVAAGVYGAALLREGVESHKHNYTRFFVMTARARTDEVRAHLMPAVAAGDHDRRTSLLFRIPNQPGGLHQALAAFAQHRVDLTKIESRPIEGQPWEYSFHVDVRGDAADAPVAAALAALAKGTDHLRVLGSYARFPLNVIAGDAV